MRNRMYQLAIAFPTWHFLLKSSQRDDNNTKSYQDCFKTLQVFIFLYNITFITDTLFVTDIHLVLFIIDILFITDVTDILIVLDIPFITDIHFITDIPFVIDILFVEFPAAKRRFPVSYSIKIRSL